MTQEDQFVALIKTHEGLIYKVAAVYMDDPEDRKDLYQDIVFQLWKYFDSFRGEAKVTTWMYRVAMNTAITKLKKHKRKTEVTLNKELSTAFEAYDATVEEKLIILRKHIERLDKVDKGIILLLLEGKSYEEIAEITGLSATAIGTRIHRIKKKLKTNIKAQHHEF